MKPFIISIEERVGKLEEVVESVFIEFEKIGGVKIPREYVGRGDGKRHGDIEWYIGQAPGPKCGCVHLSKLWELFEQEPWQRIMPHYEFMIFVKTCLYHPPFGFVSGRCRPKISDIGRIFDDKYSDGRPYIPGIVISLRNHKKWYRRDWESTLYCLAAHELGHFYGLPGLFSPNLILLGSHCRNENCAMAVWTKRGKDICPYRQARRLKKLRKLFCDYDLETLRQNLRELISSSSNLDIYDK